MKILQESKANLNQTVKRFVWFKQKLVDAHENWDSVLLFILIAMPLNLFLSFSYGGGCHNQKS